MYYTLVENMLYFGRELTIQVVTLLQYPAYTILCLRQSAMFFTTHFYVPDLLFLSLVFLLHRVQPIARCLDNHVFQ